MSRARRRKKASQRSAAKSGGRDQPLTEGERAQMSAKIADLFAKVPASAWIALIQIGEEQSRRRARRTQLSAPATDEGTCDP